MICTLGAINSDHLAEADEANAAISPVTPRWWAHRADLPSSHKDVVHLLGRNRGAGQRLGAGWVRGAPCRPASITSPTISCRMPKSLRLTVRRTAPASRACSGSTSSASGTPRAVARRSRSRERGQSARRWFEWHSPPSAAQRLCKSRTGPRHRCEADIADVRSVENKPDRRRVRAMRETAALVPPICVVLSLLSSEVETKWLLSIRPWDVRTGRRCS